MSEYQRHKTGGVIQKPGVVVWVEREEVFVPVWFDGSPEAVERLTGVMHAALRVRQSESAERISAG